MDNLSVVRH